MLGSESAYLDGLREKHADLIASNKNRRVKDIELGNMIDRISRASPSSMVVDEEMIDSVKNFEQPQSYEAPRTFR